jgi:hypothetical protein
MKRLAIGCAALCCAWFFSLAVQGAEISNFDASGGLNLDGEILYAVNFGGTAHGEIEWNGIVFTPDDETDGFEHFSTHRIENNWAAPDLGDEDLDLIISTITWSQSPSAVEMEMDVTAGETYNLQLLFYEACCNRGFDVLVEDEEIVEDFAIHENHLDWDGVGNWGIQAGRQDGVLITETVTASSNTLSVALGGDLTAPDYPDNNGHISALILSIAGGTALQPGDADQDLDFDQLDLVKVQVGAKYLSGTAATWGEGDWNGAPGGSPGSPPAGDGLFDQVDIIAALGAGWYLKGPYAAINSGGVENDGQTSIGYDPSNGHMWVDAPAGVELTSVNIDSAGGIFTGAAAENLGGSFDNDADNNIFKATFGGSFGTISFGNVAQTGLSEDFVANDLTVVGSLAGGGDLGNVDLIYVPEPSSLALLLLSAIVCLKRRRRN